MTDLPPSHPPTAPAPAPAQGARGKGRRIALALSVALNLGFVGLAAGAFLRGGPHDRMVRELDFGVFGAAFSREDRAELRRGFFDRAGDMRDMRSAMRQDVAALLAVLRSEPLDRAALAEVLARQGRRMAERLELGQALVADRIAAMTPAERGAFADRLEGAVRRRD